ncbi:MAG: hypothetical protein ACI4Q3_01635 [Kiritimatiellia bacterium]
MKKLVVAVVLVSALGLVAEPLSCASEKWDANPLAWIFDAARGEVRSSGLDSLAVLEGARSAKVRVTARITPEASGTNGWSTIGVALVDDVRNYWHAALVRSPDGGRFFELTEMRNGNWLAQTSDRLAITARRQTRSWDYGETYEFSLESDPAGIRGTIRDAAGDLIWEMGYAYPAPAADGTVAAVTCGRPALHANGGFRGRFAHLDASCSDACSRQRETAAVPPYESDSFVPEVKDRATGFFRVVQKDGRWWVIDPKGRGTVLLGIDHVTYWGHHSQRTNRSIHHEVNKVRFPNKADWEADTLKRLKDWGFNMLGAGCDGNLKHRGLAHTVFLSIGEGLCWNDPAFYICPNEHRPCSAFPNVFHPQFAQWADYIARTKCAPNRDDPWLFGYFIDNELAWWGRGAASTGLFDAVSRLPDTHSARQAQKKFLSARGIAGTVPDAVKLDFLKHAADIYFRVSSEAIRRHDPNHLVMGARFAGLGGAHPAVWEVAGKYCDVVTFNCYPWADLDRNVVMTDRGGLARRVADAFAEHYELVKRPMLITEWSFPALDSGLPCTGGAGQRFQTQALRTQATELFAKTMLALPFLVGYDYFMWVDEPAAGISDAFPEDSNYGLINEQGVAYPEITDMFTRLHRNVGQWRKAGLPPTNAVASVSEGMTADQFLSTFKMSTQGLAFTRTGDRYAVRTAAGLELAGRVGGWGMLESVKLKGRDMGRYTGMLNNRVDGGLQWHDATRALSADWCAQNGRGVLTVASENWYAKDRGFMLTHRITVFADRPWFLCELVSAKNLGQHPIDVNAFYFREYSPFALEKKDARTKTVPNLWKAPKRDGWFSAAGDAYFGGLTFAPTAAMFMYHLMSNGKSQHPDAMFVPEGDLILAPGAVYEPRGTIWMLALCGLDGFGGWTRALDETSR